ncbi:hypothetical protein CPHLJ_6g3625 [Cryptosporidium parvum]|uniref:Uncharacterized protein n=1 Tax=Cryptosporidium parvum TaxID=5807 RepID=A0A7S7RFV5_CRYPV|nr:Uncharacterized protein CPATCC_0015210 [Cryptosporidium parvum]WKS78477.1 hypothetical protein CPCDC_6g3625 [Cryptosporidium sp. 43IA8]WRK32968.1 Uncharacterized protein cpbgf_6003623 [Cryptosporidium parvum]|eukprot:QOY41248.1 hypothetical protein CPATCC_002922 [Cryptosporidium parvum]
MRRQIFIFPYIHYKYYLFCLILFNTLFLGLIQSFPEDKKGEVFKEINTSLRSSCYDIANYLSQTMQETPPSVVGYFELIDCLENPKHETDLEDRARSAIESMDNIMQEIPTQFIGTLFYTCTVKKIDTLLTAIIRNGFFYATKELINRKIYGIQHLLHARDSSKENVVHLAVRAESVILIDLLWKHLSNQIRFLLDEKNYSDERPVDLSEEIRCTTCTTRLKEIYRITSQAHLSELPPPPPVPHIPELEVLQSVETNDYEDGNKNLDDDSSEERSDSKSNTTKKNIRRVNSKEKRRNELKHDYSESFSPLDSEEDYSRLHNKGYIDLNGMIAAEQKRNIFDSKMILAITCTIALLIFMISCVCLLKK